jgi:lysophospholipase L1-like esterase
MIVFLGDSIFEWWDEKSFKLYFSEFQPVNFGTAGYTTKDVIQFLELTRLHSLKPEVIILLIGTNNSDHDYTTSQTLDEITRIVELLVELTPDSEVILLGILPRGFVPEDRKRILNEHVNKRLQVAKFPKEIHYADIGYLFMDNYGMISKDIMYDGLHLTQTGYILLSEALSRFISAILSS